MMLHMLETTDGQCQECGLCVTLRAGSGLKLSEFKSQPSIAHRPESSGSGPHPFHWPINVVAS